MELMIQWVEKSCLYCKAIWAMPESSIKRLKNDHKTFYCPMCGGSHHYPQKTEEEKLKEKLNWCTRRIETEEDEIRELEGAVRKENYRARAYKGLANRLKVTVGGNGKRKE